MQINKININKYFVIFIFVHLIIWTLVPSISNVNLPLDTIEALAWGNEINWGYNKHPPLSAWSVELFYLIFGNQDWAYYLLSQLFVVSSFIIIFKFSENFLKSRIHSLISVMLLEGIYFYNYTTPEFNVYVCALPFLTLTVFFCWRGITKNDHINWLLFGFFAGMGVLSHYLFLYLLFAFDIFFIYLIINKKLDYKCLISLFTFFLILTPHLIWLVDNNYTTITYAFERTGLENKNLFKSHIIHPLFFLGKQIGILVPFFVMLLIIIKKFVNKFNLKDKKLLFLLSATILPITLIFLTSFILGIKIRTMWMTPFYLFFGVLFIYIFQKKIILKKIKYFFTVFLILFIFSPLVYFYISVTQTDKRTDYPGKKVAKIVQEKWNDKFINEIVLVAGDEWYGGNLSYHLKSRPKWDNILEEKGTVSLKDVEGGFVIIGDPDTLIEICFGTFIKVEKQGICMVGKKK